MPEFKAGTREEVESGAAQYTNTETLSMKGVLRLLFPIKLSSMVGQDKKIVELLNQELVYIIGLLYIR